MAPEWLLRSDHILAEQTLRFGHGLNKIGKARKLAKPPAQKPSATPDDFPQVEPPEELFPTNNIRFVMWETAKLTERVEALTKAVEKLSSSFEKTSEKQTADLKEKLADIKVDLKDTDTKVVSIEGKVNFVKGALWVFGGIFAVALVVLGVAGKALLG